MGMKDWIYFIEWQPEKGLTAWRYHQMVNGNFRYHWFKDNHEEIEE